MNRDIRHGLSVRWMFTAALALLGLLFLAGVWRAQAERRSRSESYLQAVLSSTDPLALERGTLLPIYLATGHKEPLELPFGDEKTTGYLHALSARGLGYLSPWRRKQRPLNEAEDVYHSVLSTSGLSAKEAVRIGRLQSAQGLRVAVEVTGALGRIYDDERRAHIREDGTTFFDDSFLHSKRIGCPFAAVEGIPEFRKRLSGFIEAYKSAELDVDLAIVDWEIDGPLEWNGAWESAGNCSRCKANLQSLDDFGAFQTTLREIRSRIQREGIVVPLREAFPDILVGNYGVYPHNGYRYWYDHYETIQPEHPFVAEYNAQHRPWAPEFDATGYTTAMPVVYNRSPIYEWYPFEDTDYRWFYSGLKVGSNAAAHTPTDIPLLTFIHWRASEVAHQRTGRFVQHSRENYREMLWHLILRGHDGFVVWLPSPEQVDEIALAQEVYNETLKFRDILESGTPITFDLPDTPGPVVSGLRLENRILARRTDFINGTTKPAELMVDGTTISIPRGNGSQLFDLVRGGRP